MDDMISRQAAIESMLELQKEDDDAYGCHIPEAFHGERAAEALKSLPSAQPEIKPIDYQDCANAMLRMWMDKVVTDGEYNRIMDKLNAFWGDDK